MLVLTGPGVAHAGTDWARCSSTEVKGNALEMRVCCLFVVAVASKVRCTFDEDDEECIVVSDDDDDDDDVAHKSDDDNRDSDFIPSVSDDHNDQVR